MAESISLFASNGRFAPTRKITATIKDTTELERGQKEMFEYPESVAGDFLAAMRADIDRMPLGRLICISDPMARWEGPRIIFFYRTNKIEELAEKADVLHDNGLLRHDEGPMYWTTENLVSDLRHSETDDEMNLL